MKAKEYLENNHPDLMKDVGKFTFAPKAVFDLMESYAESEVKALIEKHKSELEQVRAIGQNEGACTN